MSNSTKEKEILGDKALEMVMRDVLYGMEDLAAMLGYRGNPGGVEILSIEPASAGTDTPAANNELSPPTGLVLPFPAIPSQRPRPRRSRAS